MFLTFLYSLVGWVSLCAAEGPQSSLDLSSAIREGLENSPAIQKSVAVSDEAIARTWEGYAGFLPTLTLTGEHYLEKRYLLTPINFGGNAVSFPALYPDNSFTLRASMPIFDGFQNTAKFSAVRLQKDAAEEEQEWTRFSVARDIELRFFQALAAQKLREVSEQNVKTIEEHLGQIKNFKKGGIATNFDVLRVEVQLSEAQTDAIQARDHEELSREKLAIAMGVPDDRRALVGDFSPPAEEKLQKAEPKNVSRADLNALMMREQSSEKMSSFASRYWWPRISLGAQYMAYNNINESMTDFDQYRAAWNVGVFLNWSIFDANVFSKQGQAEAQKVQSEKTLLQAQQKIPYDLNYWKRRYAYSSALFRARQADATKAEESVRLAREGFKAGVRTNTDVLDSELDLFRARAGIVNALLSASEAKVNLELALGQPLN